MHVWKHLQSAGKDCCIKVECLEKGQWQSISVTSISQRHSSTETIIVPSTLIAFWWHKLSLYFSGYVSGNVTIITIALFWSAFVVACSFASYNLASFEAKLIDLVFSGFLYPSNPLVQSALFGAIFSIESAGELGSWETASKEFCNNAS